MTSRLLARIDAEIASCVSDVDRSELLARKAGYLSRIGAFSDAEAILRSLREQFGDGRSPRVSIWLMLSEGLFNIFHGNTDAGVDRIVRAQALAAATRDRRLIASTSAWRAHTQHERSEFKGMVRTLETAFACAGEDDHEALARSYMVQANALMSCGERVRAQACYTRARHHALEAGDQATIDAMLYNKASFGVAWLRARGCFGERDDDWLSLLRMELASSRNYQNITGAAAVTHWVYLWDARLAMLSEEFESGLNGLRSVRTQGHFPSQTLQQPLIDLEIAYCLWKLDRRSEASESASHAESFDPAGVHEDEQLVAAWLRAELITNGILRGDEADAKRALTTQKEVFDQSSRALLRLLGELRDAPALPGQSSPH